MAKISMKSIYQQNDKFKDQIPLVPFMKSEERTILVKEIQALIDTAREAEESTPFQDIKKQLENIIETWEKFLIDIKRMPIRKLSVISQVAKTSPTLTAEVPREEQITEYIRRFPSYAGHILSSGKVNPNSPVTIP